MYANGDDPRELPEQKRMNRKGDRGLLGVQDWESKNIPWITSVVVGHETYSSAFRSAGCLCPILAKQREYFGWLNGVIQHCRGEPYLHETKDAAIPHVFLEVDLGPDTVQFIMQDWTNNFLNFLPRKL